MTRMHAGNYPKLFKNALDWLVSSGELYGKPATVAMQRAADGTATVDSAVARIVAGALQALQSAVAESCPTSR